MKKNVENSMKPIAIRIHLHKLLGLEELLQVAHLPHARDDQNGQLADGPPEDALVGGLAGGAEALLAVPLVVLLLADLVGLVEQLADAQLQLGELLLARELVVVDGVLAHLDVQVDAQVAAAEPGARVRVEADEVLAGRVRRE